MLNYSASCSILHCLFLQYRFMFMESRSFRFTGLMLNTKKKSKIEYKNVSKLNCDKTKKLCCEQGIQKLEFHGPHRINLLCNIFFLLSCLQTTPCRSDIKDCIVNSTLSLSSSQMMLAMLSQLYSLVQWEFR